MAQDDELLAIQRIMRILETMTPMQRARVIEYVNSRAESLGMPPPPPERPGARPAEPTLLERDLSAWNAPQDFSEVAERKTSFGV